MKPYFQRRISSILFYLSTILIIGGALLFIPMIIGLIYGESQHLIHLFKGFLLPGILAIVLGVVGRFLSKAHPLSLKDSMVICALAWIVLSMMGAIPYVEIIQVSFLDAVFETMSGFTTTGITVLTGLDTLPHSILFWRALTQWIGGLGILSMFILVGLKGGAAANKLFLAEGHKIATPKPSPGIFHTAKILWMLYIVFTCGQILVLMILGVGFFDALTHAFTTLSTGGYSMYDQSIAHYRLAGYAHHHLIELTFLFFMLAGGINFFIHYRVWTGSLKSLWDNTEMRYYWSILIGVTLFILLSHYKSHGLDYTAQGVPTSDGFEALGFHLKDIGFQVVSILTTTGYATRDINTPYFTAFAKQLFLILMVVGGCAGSTGGGFKVIRVAILSRLIRNRLYQLNSSRLARVPLTIDNHIVEDEEIKRIFTIFFMWIILLIVGGAITAFFSDLSGWQSFSGMFSALGNIGPCYMTVQEMIQLHPIVKLTYIFGMLAGRLEIIPVLLIFSKRYFK